MSMWAVVQYSSLRPRDGRQFGRKGGTKRRSGALAWGNELNAGSVAGRPLSGVGEAPVNDRNGRKAAYSFHCFQLVLPLSSAAKGDS